MRVLFTSSLLLLLKCLVAVIVSFGNQVLWSDGRISWLKESNMPKKVLDLHKAGNWIQQKPVLLNEFGQRHEELQLNNDSDERMDPNISYTVKS